jgi:hypothetical protein
MRQKINYIRHLGVLFLTLVIFFLGVLIGGNVEELRVESLYTQLQEQDLEYQSVLTESRYIDYLTSLKEEGQEISCETIKGSFFTSIENLDNSRLKLENYINSGNFQEEEFSRLKEHYGNVQINYWILANRIGNTCEGKLNTLLYFYSDDELCLECEDQGVHITYVKQRLKEDILVFSFDSQSLTGSSNLLAQKYEIKGRESPTLIINEEIYGFKDNSEIFDILCEQGLDADDICSK